MIELPGIYTKIYEISISDTFEGLSHAYLVLANFHLYHTCRVNAKCGARDLSAAGWLRKTPSSRRTQPASESSADLAEDTTKLNKAHM